MATTPTSKKKQLGLILKRMIESWMSEGDKRSYTAAGKLIGISQSRISELVAGKGSITLGDLKLLSERLGFDDPEHIGFLFRLREAWSKRGAWSSNVNVDVLHTDMQLLVDMEWDATTVRYVGTEIVPGLLQTEPYMRAVFAKRSREGADVTVDDVVQARLARQQSLMRSDKPLQLQVILSESCLQRRVPGLDVMVKQLEHLVELSKRENILLQVIPFVVLPEDGVIDRFELFELPTSGVLGPVELACTENPGEVRFIDTESALLSFKRAWSRLAADAMGQEDTRKFLRHIARTYKSEHSHHEGRGQ